MVEDENGIKRDTLGLNDPRGDEEFARMQQGTMLFPDGTNIVAIEMLGKDFLVLSFLFGEDFVNMMLPLAVTKSLGNSIIGCGEDVAKKKVN